MVTENNSEDEIAIDFVQLMREEKRRARQRHLKTKNTSHKTDSPSTSKKDDDDDPIKDWPNDWLSNPPLPDFVPDCVSSNPETVCYKSRYLDQDRQDRLVDWLMALPEADAASSPVNKWNTMKYAKRRVALFEDPLPLPLRQLAKALVDTGVFESNYEPNHVLVNDYTANQGILPHTDGPLYYAKTATISIGESVLFHFTPRLSTEQIGLVSSSSDVLQVLLDGNGSLVTFSGCAYSEYCHGIDEQVSIEYAGPMCINAFEGTPVLRGYRISLTFRHKVK